MSVVGTITNTVAICLSLGCLIFCIQFGNNYHNKQELVEAFRQRDAMNQQIAIALDILIEKAKISKEEYMKLAAEKQAKLPAK